MELQNITKIYNNRNTKVTALEEVSLILEDNGITALLGPSGSGKTTLLNIIAKKDNQFVGKIIGNENVELIEQGFMLIESMTVIDNLYFVESDKKKIEKLLQQFKLSEYMNHKVKNLSNGQKKRIQIIRSLLLYPDILLCDEPTASLDYENSIIVMEMLQKISEECNVIIVTHMIDLAEKYANRIIAIENGKILEDDIIHKMSKHEIHEIKQVKKNLKNHMYFIVKNILSKKLYYFINIILFVTMLMSIVLTINISASAQNQIEKDIVTYYNQNIISSTPKEIRNDTVYYTKFDTYQYQQIKDIVSSVPEIIAYTFGRDDTMYSYELDYSRSMKSGRVIIDDCLYYYLMPQIPSVDLIPFKQFDSYSDQGKSLIYEIKEGNNLPMLYGKMPMQDDEIVIDKHVAQIVCDIYKNNSFEELIGEDIQLYKNEIFSSSKFDAVSFQCKIVGIADIETIYENQIFMKENAWMKKMCNTFEIEENEWKFEYADFMLDPLCDKEKVIKKINNIYQGVDSQFKEKNYELNPSYRIRSISGKFSDIKPMFNMRILSKSAMVISLVLIVSYIGIDLLNIKQYKKEDYILYHYGYSIKKISIIKTIILSVISSLVTLFFGNSICIRLTIFIKDYFDKYDFSNITIQFDMHVFLIVASLITIIICLKEMTLNEYFIKKYK